MGNGKPFLTARWSDVALVTWRIPADTFLAQLPLAPDGTVGLEPDRLPDDPVGTAYASFVAFRFLETRVKGVSVPMHTDFPEVNLRVYVRTTTEPVRRGVLFISELVPKPAIAMVANLLYHEHYRAVPMRCDVRDEEPRRRRMVCEIELGERTHRLVVVGRRPPEVPPADGLDHFFKEHEWGFGSDPERRLVTYRVEHPVWAVYPTDLDHVELDVDFEELYGAPWGVIGEQPPFHVAFAVGSKISVFPRQ